MKKLGKVLLIVLLVLVVAVAVVAVWQRDNLKALYVFATRDSAAIAQDLGRCRDEHRDVLSGKVTLTVTAPTLEQSDALLSGAATAASVKDALGITYRLECEIKQSEDLIDRCVAELYACKVDIMAALGVLKQETVIQWLALPPEEQTDTRKKELGFAGLNQCYALESEVDNEVRAILDAYRMLLKGTDADVTILDTLWTQYEEEKAAEKAYYLDKYLR